MNSIILSVNETIMEPVNTNAILLQNTIVALLQNYKFKTADKSEVCDGTNWETFRIARNHQMEVTEISKTLQSQMKVKEIAQTPPVYRPVDSSTRINETKEITIVASRELRRDKSPSSFISQAPLADSDNKFGILDMLETSEKPHVNAETRLLIGTPQQQQVVKWTSADTETESVSDSDISSHKNQASQGYSASSRSERTACLGYGGTSTSGRYSSSDLAGVNSPDLPGLTSTSSRTGSCSTGLNMQYRSDGDSLGEDNQGKRQTHCVARQDYHLGDLARCPSHMIIEACPQAALEKVSQLQNFDFAFIQRSDGSWQYAILAHRHLPNSDSDEEFMMFVMDQEGTTEIIQKNDWASDVCCVSDYSVPLCISIDFNQDDCSSQEDCSVFSIDSLFWQIKLNDIV